MYKRQVVYGGIIAGFLTAIVYCRIKKLYFLEYFDLAVASISMAQGFGRIGCFLAGCCYGDVYKRQRQYLETDFPQFLQERRFMVEIRNLSRQRLLWMQER